MSKEVKEVWALRLNKSDKEMLEFLAEKEHRSMAGVVREMIRRRYNGGVRK